MPNKASKLTYKILSVILPSKKLRRKMRQLGEVDKNPNFHKLKHCGTGSVIRKDAKLYEPQNISVGDNCYIGSYNTIYATGNVDIGNNCALAEHVTIITLNHNYQSDTMVPFDNYSIAQDVFIGDNVWIGMKSIILAGCRIEEGAIVAAGSVVCKSVPSCAIVGGNPAKIIGWRDKEKYKEIIKNNPYKETMDWKLIHKEGYKDYLK